MESGRGQGLWEASVYVPGDPDPACRNRIAAHCLEGVCRIPRSKSRQFGDVDWIAKSLEGLKPVRAGRFLVHGRTTATP
jgi:ribosomal protein L11 methyltransferase